MSADPKHIQPDDSDDLDSEEMVNDSLGEITPSDSTGLDSDKESEARDPRRSAAGSAPAIPRGALRRSRRGV